MNKIRLFAFGITAVMLAGCSTDETGSQIPGEGTDNKVYMTVSASTDGSRTVIDENYKSTWAAGDRIGLFYDKSEVQAGWILSVTGSTIKNGKYQNLPYLLDEAYDGQMGGTFAITNDLDNDHPGETMPYTGNFYWQTDASTATFYAYYPYTFSGVNGGHMDNVAAFPYTLTTVQGGTLESVAALDLAYGKVTVERGSEEYVEANLNFSMGHMFSVLEFEVTNATGENFTLNGVKMSSAAGIGGSMTVDFTTGSITGAAATSVTASFADGVELTDGETAVVYMVVAPADCSNSTFTVMTSAGSADFTGGKLFEAGKYYYKTLEVTELGGSASAVTVDFEEAELGDVTLEGYNPTTYHNVLTGKPLAEKCVDEDNVYLVDCMVYDGLLYAENGVSFGSFYSDFEALWGGVYDTCYGFVMSSNNDIEEGTVANQYSVYSATNGANKFAVAYDGSWWSPTYQRLYGTYDLATFVLEKSGTVRSADFANTTYTYKTIMATDPNVNYAIKATGYLNGSETATLSVALAKNGTLLTDWTEVDMSGLGVVDKVTFTVDWDNTSSAVKSPEQWLPFYWCIDNVKVEFEE